MRNARRLWPVLLIGLALAGVASADAPTAGTSPPVPASQLRHRGPLHHLLRRLNLSTEQQAQVRSIYAQTRPQLQTLLESSRATRAALATTAPTDHPAYDALLATAKSDAAGLVQLRSDLWSQIYAVLTPAQQAAIPGLVAEERAAREARRAAWRESHGLT
ncbi:MAG: Spy/CpxP family protein refolding chaperone [Proteobacteria bacterium]|nr:Spy/CpxP family protein refolding chaperone [Pseudomonadota bacterium]